MSDHDETRTPEQEAPQASSTGSEGELDETELEKTAGGFSLGLIGTGTPTIRENGLRDLERRFVRRSGIRWLRKN